MNKKRKDLFKLVLKKKIFIILITMVFATTGVLYTFVNFRYVASEKILVGNSENEDSMDTYKELIMGSNILERVIQNLEINISVNDLSKMVDVKVIDNTKMIEIKVSGEDENIVNSISNEISNVFIENVDTIYGNTELYKVDQTANYYHNGNMVVVGICSAIVGFILSSLFFMVCAMFNTKIKSYKNIEELTGLRPLILIPDVKKISKRKLDFTSIRMHKSQVFKNLMTNIQFLNVNNLKSKSIIVTSSKPSEGKTYTAINLAIEFSRAGKKVVLIDGDMRNGRISKIFNLPNNLGLSNYLSNLDTNGNNINERITKFIKDIEIKNLNIITAGNRPPNPDQLVRDEKMKELIKDLKVFYDVIIFDAVSILESKEAYKLAKVCDLTLILSTYKNTKKEELEIAYNKISEIESSVIGIALNRVPTRKLKTKKNLRNIFIRIGSGLKNFLVFVLKIKDVAIIILSNFKNSFQNLKELINEYAMKQEIRLIEAAPEPVLSKVNVIEDVFESKNAKIAISDEEKFKQKLDSMKANIKSDIKNEHDLIAEKKAIIKKEKAVKQKKKVEEKKIDEIIAKEQLIEKQKLERQKKEEEKKKEKEKLKNYEEIDLTKQENITEEMIRRQVELDDLIRIAEKEEENAKLNLKKEKLNRKLNQKIKIKKSLNQFRENMRNISNNDKKARKEAEKKANKERIQKVKEEKRLYKEMEKQKRLEEMRIREEIQEDNLYPRIKM